MQLELEGTTCKIVHEPSSAILKTTPPKDNGGLGDAFSPTDLFTASLAACALTTMQLVANRERFTLPSVRATVTKHMANEPRRVAAIDLSIELSAPVDPQMLERLRKIVLSCPVMLSLSQNVEVRVHMSDKRLNVRQ